MLSRMLTPNITRVLSLGLALAASSALACRYSVRDTGFVEIGAEPYRLLLGGKDAATLAPSIANPRPRLSSTPISSSPSPTPSLNPTRLSP